MRMWCVDPSKMGRKHLLGEHVETHMFVGIRLDGYLDEGLVDVDLLFERHNELAAEMERRGYKHKSLLPEFKWSNDTTGTVNIKDNEIELHRRCKDCQF